MKIALGLCLVALLVACGSPSVPPPDSGKVVAKHICAESRLDYPGQCFQLDMVYPAGEDSEFFQIHVDRAFYHATSVGTWLRRLEDRDRWTHDVEGDERP